MSFTRASERDIETVVRTVRAAAGSGPYRRRRPFLTSRRDQIIALAARHTMPAVYPWRTCRPRRIGELRHDLADGFRQVGVYIGRILKGAKPADLPVVQPTKFEFVINLKTAKALGLDVPPMLLARADEVIE